MLMSSNRNPRLLFTTCLSINISVITLILAAVTGNPIILGIAIGSTIISLGISIIYSIKT